MVSIVKLIFAPKLYLDYDDPNSVLQMQYQPSMLEKWGDGILSVLYCMYSIGCYTSPLIASICFRRGFLVAESLLSITKMAVGVGFLYVFSLCMRGIGRSQSPSYEKFIRVLEEYRSKPGTDTKVKLGRFDFEFGKWPVDFDARMTKVSGQEQTLSRVTQNKSIWKCSTPCEMAAYIAIHTFGIRMIFPGCLKVLQFFLGPIIIQGRLKLVQSGNGTRYKLKTRDSNDIDLMFVDNRNKSENGSILVICTEGNAGFYEIGIMSTPMSLKYSVVGWNHPGFAGSTGLPYPDQEENAIDSVVIFAMQHLGFSIDCIILFAWSIGAYNALWAAKNYPDIKILDATFDDILHLALNKMPEMVSNVVRLGIREHVNLNNMDLINHYHGPILIIRRTEDEIICTQEGRIETNRGNNLLVHMLKYRYPNIFGPKQILFTLDLLSKPLMKIKDNDFDEKWIPLMASHLTTSGKTFPILTGEDMLDERRSQIAEYLVRKHLCDFKSSHCTPLPSDLFRTPWDPFKR